MVDDEPHPLLTAIDYKNYGSLTYHYRCSSTDRFSFGRLFCTRNALRSDAWLCQSEWTIEMFPFIWGTNGIINVNKNAPRRSLCLSDHHCDVTKILEFFECESMRAVLTWRLCVDDNRSTAWIISGATTRCHILRHDKWPEYDPMTTIHQDDRDICTNVEWSGWT